VVSNDGEDDAGHENTEDGHGSGADTDDGLLWASLKECSNRGHLRW
jgi:hypothetical protein